MTALRASISREVLIEWFRQRLAATGWHVARTRDYHLIRRSFYSPIPDIDRLPAHVWQRRTALAGINFDTARQLEFAERQLEPYINEPGFPIEAEDGAAGYYLRNGWYVGGDAEITYAMVRHRKPRRVMELGSGYSTLVLARACERNRSEGYPGELVTYDPYPGHLAVEETQGLTALKRTPAQLIPIDEFAALSKGDVLFVDTSHVVRIGGEVNHLILEILPLLTRGVAVHFHDIWLPNEYWRALSEVWGVYWTEQYLLQAFLAGNRGYEVLFATHAVLTDHPSRLQALIPTVDPTDPPTSFWIVRTDSVI